MDQEDVTMSVSVPRNLRLRIEEVRLARGRRQRRLPKLRDLLVEALGLFLDAEASAATRTTKAVR